jgi:hypothetical protein
MDSTTTLAPSAQDWTKVHPRGVATIQDLAELETQLTGREVHRRTVYRRLEGSENLREKWAPAVIGKTASGKIYDVQTYLELRLVLGARWDTATEEED